MDRNLHTDDFVRLLREKSDEFRMYPSKRIWFSIYNNIHPCRKWPSVAMSITLISALLLVGYLNTNNAASSSAKEKNSQVNTQNTRPLLVYSPFPEYTSTKKSTIESGSRPNASIVSDVQSQVPGSGDISSTSSKLSAQQQNFILHKQSLGYSSDSKLNSSNNPNNITVIVETSAANRLATASPILNNGQVATINESVIPVYQSDPIARLNRLNTSPEIVTNKKVASHDDHHKYDQSIKVDDRKVTAAKASFTTPDQNVISAEDKEWIENYALYNRPAPKKWKGKLAWQMYVTPSVVYRVLTNDPNFGVVPNSAPLAIPAVNSDINKDVIQKPSIGLEIGAGLQYPILKGVKLKTGLQLNFTRYNSHAFHNTHPVATKLTMRDFETNSTYEIYRTTPYSNKTGLEAIKLHNETLQVSIPVGVDFKVIGNESLQWNIGLAIQPTFVIAGKSYLISSDRRNYVQDNSMLNRWNLNAGIETFISYKHNGLTWQIGPQFRSQLFSTNNKKFITEEKLTNYGIKIGVSKTLK